MAIIFSFVLHMGLLPLLNVNFFEEKPKILHIQLKQLTPPVKPIVKKQPALAAKSKKVQHTAKKREIGNLWEPPSVSAPSMNVKSKQYAVAKNKLVNDFVGTSKLRKKKHSVAESQAASKTRGNNSFIAQDSQQTVLGNRKIIFRPPNPKLHIPETVSVAFRITVLPNGVVSKVVPLKKRNAKLEQIAKQLLFRYRFESITDDVVQKGVFTIVLKRN